MVPNFVCTFCSGFRPAFFHVRSTLTSTSKTVVFMQLPNEWGCKFKYLKYLLILFLSVSGECNTLAYYRWNNKWYIESRILLPFASSICTALKVFMGLCVSHLFIRFVCFCCWDFHYKTRKQVSKKNISFVFFFGVWDDNDFFLSLVPIFAHMHRRWVAKWLARMKMCNLNAKRMQKFACCGGKRRLRILCKSNMHAIDKRWPTI